MDTATLTGLVKELNEANTAGKTEDVTRLLERMKKEVVPTEEILRTAKAGVAVGKLRTHASPSVSNLAKDVVKLWKEAVEAGKKRKREADGDGESGKRAKAEGSSATASPAAAAASPATHADVKPKPSSSTLAAAKSASPPRRPPLSTIDSSRTVPRTAKSDGVSDKLKAAGGGDDVRDKCVALIYDALAGDSTAEKRIITERAVAIEKAVYEMLNESTGNDYRAKVRSLFLNLKDKGNPGLRNEIVLGDVDADKLVRMSKDEMASESVRMMKEKIASDNLFKAKAVGETQAETDAFKCGRCLQRKCTYYQMQTRSADEPMTTFVNCTNCGNKWKFS